MKATTRRTRRTLYQVRGYDTEPVSESSWVNLGNFATMAEALDAGDKITRETTHWTHVRVVSVETIERTTVLYDAETSATLETEA